MSSHTLLATITEMEARLGEMRQQLVQSMYAPPASYPLFPQQPPHPQQPQQQQQQQQRRQQQQRQPQQQQLPYPPGFGPRPRGRVPYSSPSVHPIPLQSHRPYSAPFTTSASSQPFPTVPLSAVLRPQEEVLVRILLRKGSQEDVADLVAVFDGEKLAVTRCELIPSLVGVSVVKPGEILYRFMEELHSAGHLKRTFTVAPWKLCSVVREGVTVSLEELRRQHLNSA